MTSNNATFKDENSANSGNLVVKDSEVPRELSFEVLALHKGDSDYQEFWAAAEHDEPCGPQRDMQEIGFARYMNTWFTNEYLPSSPPEYITRREESQPAVEPSTFANMEDPNHSSSLQCHPSSVESLPSQSPLAVRQIGRDGIRGLPSSPGLRQNNINASPLTIPYEPTADNIRRTQNSSQPLCNQHITSQQRQTWARDLPSLGTDVSHDEMNFDLDDFVEYSNGLPYRTTSDQEDHDRFVYAMVPEQPPQRPMERLPLNTSFRNQELLFPEPQSEMRSVPNHFSQIHMGNGRANRGYQSSNTHMPRQIFMNENSVPISHQEHPTNLGQWRRVQEVYGTSIGVLLTSMIIMNADVSNYAEKDRWLIHQGLSDVTRQILHGRIRVPPQISGAMYMDFPPPRKRKELKEAIKVAVEPSSWPGNTEFSALRVHFESIRRKALELLELLREDFNNIWDEHRDRMYNN